MKDTFQIGELVDWKRKKHAGLYRCRVIDITSEKLRVSVLLHDGQRCDKDGMWLTAVKPNSVQRVIPAGTPWDAIDRTSRTNQESAPDIGGRIKIHFPESRIEEMMVTDEGAADADEREYPELCEICERDMKARQGDVDWNEHVGLTQTSRKAAADAYSNLTIRKQINVTADRYKAIGDILSVIVGYIDECPNDAFALLELLSLSLCEWDRPIH